MSERNLRDSTRRVTEDQKEKSRVAEEIRKEKKTSKALKRIHRQEEKLYLAEALELAEYTVEHLDLENKDSSEKSDSKDEINSDSDVFDINIKEVPACDEWQDPLGVAKTPQKVTQVVEEAVTDLPSASWSTKVNQFFPPNCESTPARNNRESIRSTASNLPSPVRCLEKIVEEERSNSIFDLKNTNTDNTGMMEEENYNTRLVAIKKLVVKVHLRIDEFTYEALTVNLKDKFESHLDRIRGVFEETRDTIYDLITDLDEEADKERISKLKQIDKQLTDKFKKNEKEVREEMIKLLAANDENTNGSVKSKEDKAIEEKTLKFKIRMENHLKKTKALNETILAVGNCDEMSEQEVRKNLMESKEWEKKVDNLLTGKETIDEETVGLELDEDLKSSVRDNFNQLLDTVQTKIKQLTLLDSQLGLHTLAPSKVKENVVYPEAFKGEPGEDVYKFAREFKEAILADHVRACDEVKTLVKHLKGEAKRTVGEHHEKLDDALDDLKASFGNPQWIWQTLKNDLEKKVNMPAWGKPNTYDRLKTLNIMLDFIRRAQSLAKEHEGLFEEVYSASTISMIKLLVPPQYRDKMNLLIPMECAKKEKLSRIHNILDMEKDSTLNGIPDNINYSLKKSETYNPRKSENYNPKANQFSKKNKNFPRRSNHDCHQHKHCITDWDMLGCVELYKLATVDERKGMLSSLGKCYMCGADRQNFNKNKSPPNQNTPHRCKWLPAGKEDARCTGNYGQGRCPNAAAMCLYHHDNASLELRSWLARSSMKFTIGVVDHKPNKHLVESSTNKRNHLIESSTNKIDKISNRPDDREKLQTGEVSLDMSDDEIYTYFTEDMRQKGFSDKVHPIPKGEPVFILCIFQGKKGPVQTLIDSGANCWLAKDMIPQLELNSMKLMEGPIPIGVASGMVVYANAEWASLLPLSDGSYQSVRGLTMDKVTGDMTELNLVPYFEQMKVKNKSVSQIQNLQVPKVIGGEVQMILGIKYQNIYPEVVHTFPNGLTIFKSKLMPTKPGTLACIGGPVEALETLCGIAGAKSTLNYVSHLVQNIKAPAHRVNLAPITKTTNLVDINIPGIEEFLEADDKFDGVGEDQSETNEVDDNITENKYDGDNFQVTEQVFGDYYKEDSFFDDYSKRENLIFVDYKKDEINHDGDSLDACKCNHVHEAHLIQSEMEKYMKMQDAGLDMTFKCPRCRNCRECLQGPGREKLSLLQETEQMYIKESVRIDFDAKQAIVHLAFTADPDHHLTNNFHIAKKRLENICKKYGTNTEVSSMIMRGFQKLLDRKHVIPWEDLPNETKERIEHAPSSYFIPWDVGFKETSLSTPARPTFDASSRTPGGSSLNDLLAKGNADLVDLVLMVLNWLVGPVAVCGDISQFYNTVQLAEDHWQYQQVLWYDEMDPSKPLRRRIIRTAIYGVRCVGAQTEEIMRQVADHIKEELENVRKLLVKLRYVDDFGKANETIFDAQKLIEDTENVLDTVQMKVKGWAQSWKAPPEQISEDGKSVAFAGLSWNPLLDIFSLNIESIHFGRKKRGRYPEDLVRFSGTFGKTMEEFTPIKLTRRMCTSVAARLYDIPQKLAPLHLRLKYDLRKLIKVDSSWDNPISTQLRARWVENFQKIEDLRDVLCICCPVPVDALRPTVRLLLLCDAADGGMIVSVYSGHEKPDKTWSCGHLCAKNLLAPDGWSTPKLELHALNTMANMAAILQDALDDWVETYIAAGDSEIALAWTIYEKCKLHVFHRMRVSNIRNKLKMENLFHVDGKENISDLGTRPDLLTVEQLSSGSEWLSGKPWMKEPIETVIEKGILKKTSDIILDNEKKKVFKEAVIYDSPDDKVFDNINKAHAIFDNENKVDTIVITVNAKKVAEREVFSKYIFPPLKRSFTPTVRIIALILLAVKKFKKGRLLALSQKGQNIKKDLSDLNFPPVKFKAFPLLFCARVDEVEVNEEEAGEKTNLIRIFGGSVKTKEKSGKEVLLTEEALSAALEYLYRKATAEILKFNDKKSVKKVGVMKDGILYCKTRLLESQSLRAVGELENIVDLQSFTGVNFNVPILDKHSPLAISIAMHLHYNVIKHRGAETIFRMSLQYARILQGRVLFRDITEDCVYCKKLRLRYIKQIMGPLSDCQLTISPIFFYTYVDAWGPIKAYTPGYSRNTRSSTKSFELYMVVFGCAATATINIQVMEGGKDTDCFLDAFNRFFSEACVPKVFFPDKDGALLKLLAEGEVDLRNFEGILSKERGICFRTCSAQGHSAHGRIEARIKMIQESLDRSSIRKEKLHSLGWQTVAKLVEREVNSIPLGYLHHETDMGALLRVLSPNCLKLNTSSNRAPSGIFSVPRTATSMMKRIEATYMLWYKIWNVEYIPLVAQRQNGIQKWKILVKMILFISN